jgi:hypothetical protein
VTTPDSTVTVKARLSSTNSDWITRSTISLLMPAFTGHMVIVIQHWECAEPARPNHLDDLVAPGIPAYRDGVAEHHVANARHARSPPSAIQLPPSLAAHRSGQ